MAVEQFLSIILPTYNRSRTLARAVESVLKQSYERFELIVVDDGSTDDTAEVLARFDDPRISCITLPTNQGPGAARNTGIRAAKYDLVAFQDSDDVWFENKLSVQLAALTEDIGVLYHDIIRVKRDGTEALRKTPDEIPLSIVDRINAVGEIGIVWCLIRKHLIESVGGFDEQMAPIEDTDLFIKLRLVCNFARVPIPLVYYFESEDGLTRNWKKIADSTRRLLRLHGKELAPFKQFIAQELAGCAKLEQRQEEENRQKLRDAISRSS